MASGHLCLNLTERMSWEEFPDYAEKFLRSIGGEIIRKSEGPDIRIWEVSIERHPVQFVFDDYPVMVSLESYDDQGDKILKHLRQKLALQIEK